MAQIRGYRKSGKETHVGHKDFVLQRSVNAQRLEEVH